MRMSMRRFTRLTNAFSKKVENLEAAVALHLMWYNFGRVHQILRVTPAMQAGISHHVWSIEEVVALRDSKLTHYPRMRQGKARQISPRRVNQATMAERRGLFSRGESADGTQMGRQTHQGPKGIWDARGLTGWADVGLLDPAF
jgi:hypothetical protein